MKLCYAIATPHSITTWNMSTCLLSVFRGQSVTLLDCTQAAQSKIFAPKHEGKDYTKEPGVDGKIILKRISEKQGENLWTG
jgi:hypothetical protein